MSENGFIKGPLEDQNDKINHSQAPAFPTFAKVATSGTEVAEDENLRVIRDMVNSAFRDITINDTRGVSNGGSINFTIEPSREPFVPVISEVLLPPPPLLEPLLGDAEFYSDKDHRPLPPLLGDPDPEFYSDTPINSNKDQAEVGEAPIDEPTPPPDPLLKSVIGKGKLISTKEEDVEFEATGAAALLGDDKERKSGESKKDFNEREKESKQLDKIPNVADAIAHGDASFFSGGFVPVLFTRADGQRKILTYVIEDNSHVVEGAMPGEKEGPIPADDAYYLAGGESNIPYSIAYSNDTEAVLTLADMLVDYDSDIHNSWSANFEVVTGSMTGVVTYSDDVNRYPDDGAGPPAAQTFYRLPLIRGGLTVSSGGFYQEDTLCLNGEGRQQLIKMG